MSFWVDQALARKYGHPVPPTPPGLMHGGHRRVQEGMMEIETMMPPEHDNMDGHNMGEPQDMNSTVPGGEDMGGMGDEGGNMDQGDMGQGDMGQGDMGHGDMGQGGMGQGDMGQGDMGHGDMGQGNMDHDGDSSHMGHGDTGHGDTDHGGRGNTGHGGHGNAGHGGHSNSGHGAMTYPEIYPKVFHFHDTHRVAVSRDENTMPIFECEPIAPDLVNFNLQSHAIYGGELILASESEQVVIGKLVMDEEFSPFEEFVYEEHKGKGPFSQVAYPVYEGFGDDKRLTGFLTAYLFWADFFAENLPSVVKNVVLVLENGCGQTVSYLLNSEKKATYLGEGDHHDPDYSELGELGVFSDMVRDNNGMGWQSGTALNRDYCPFSVRVYPSYEMHDSFTTSKPRTYTLLIIGTFSVTCLVILGYDWLNEKRNSAVLENARHTHQIVSSLFPAVVRDRLFAKNGDITTQKLRLRKYLAEGESKRMDKSKPIADLFPYTTILFADIAGFTAWSSVREPSQVFILLETLYGKFDAMAKTRRVFKVETIGDCYVAATGLPEPQEKHAPIMAMYAKECLDEFNEVVKELEVSLGPDTADLGLRIGINSGPVTAGVLRGEKSRFQLFGDTVNTAARMESTGIPGRIQCSQSTADKLTEAGMAEWLHVRDESVDVKGKGLIQTFWVSPMFEDETASDLGTSELGESGNGLDFAKSQKRTVAVQWGDLDIQRETAEQNKRLVEWHLELLSGLLKQIVAQRNRKDRDADFCGECIAHAKPREEVAETILMPEFDPKKARKSTDPASVELPPNVLSQLQDYIATLSCMYRGNPFHNFAHASHVTMAAKKLLSRIVAADQVVENGATRTLAKDMHGYTFGLTSDPLTQFAIIFSALIHDLDHAGVSNPQLVKEKAQVADKYSGKSVAEQNSVDLAWELLMDPSLEELRKCIYANETEYMRFRQLVVNCVIATDIFDPELKNIRNKRWDASFHDENIDEAGCFNKKATIVIEHIIQAADVSHTMQHWHVYQKWNERLFHEMNLAYQSGRGGDKNPADGWFKGELWFFDNYVIPLAQKLKECGVFGVASAECLNYAMQNRSEWEKKGEQIVREMKEKYTS